MSRKTLAVVGGVLLFGAAIFAYGVAVGRWRLPPYRLLESIYHMDAETTSVRKTLGDDFPDIRLSNPGDVERARFELRRFVWGGEEPGKSTVHTRNITSPIGAGQVRELRIVMEHGIDSIAHLYGTTSPSETLVIYHHGHNEDFSEASETITTLLEHGYPVLAFSMPLTGRNNRLAIDAVGLGRVELATHDQLALLENPIRFFLEPVAAALRALDGEVQYTDLAMIGLSGGGWTTSLYAAVDPRVTRVYPVAGSLPFSLRYAEEWGDFEQSYPALYRKANLLELYILGSAGKGRRQLQVFNKHDPCCFGGSRALRYERQVIDLLPALGGGGFRILIDESHRDHQISARALAAIIRDLEESSKPPLKR